MRLRLWRAGAGILMCLALAACAGGRRSEIAARLAGGGETQGGAELAALPWPPREDSVVSPDAWTALERKGVEYVAIGGAYEVAADLIRLKDGDGLAYALYSVPAGPAVWPLSVTLNYGLEPRAGGDHCDAWLALANYAQGRWELQQADALPYIFALPNAKDYVSPGGWCHCAVIFNGEGKVRVDGLLFRRYENPPDSPPGFRLSVTAGAVQLDWDASAGADGYRVYKAAGQDLAAATLLGETPALEYSDSAVAAGECWYYWATALRDGVASLPSGPLCAVLPQADLPAPADFWSPGSGAQSFDLAWDWAGPNPDGYTLLLKANAPHFDPAAEGVQEFTLSGAARSFTVGAPYVSTAQVYYCRLAAFKLQGPNKTRGQWTRALPCIANNIVWQFPENLGPGQAPVRAVRTADGLAAAWFDAGAVICGRRDASGNWDISDTGLNPMLETYLGQPLPSRGFDQYLDIAWHNGLCLVCAHSADTGDLWAAIGIPGGSWTQELVLGDGDPLGGTDSGVNLDCAAGPGSSGSGEYSITCAVFPRDGYGFPQTFLASRPAGGDASDWRSFDLSAEAPQLDSCNYPCCEYAQDTGLLNICLFADEAGTAGTSLRTLKFGTFNPSLATPVPEWNIVETDGTDWDGRGAGDSYCVPAQVQLVQTIIDKDPDFKSWAAYGYSPLENGQGGFFWYYEWQNPPQWDSGCTAVAGFESESWGWFPRCSEVVADKAVADRKLVAWNETRSELYLRLEQTGPFDPPYCPIPLPGMPTPQADILCLDESTTALLYADLADGMVKCALGTNPP